MKVKSFDRKNELFEAAIEEFTNKKYEEASLNNIIKNAGISKGTFYYHFKDKQALYIFILEWCIEAKLEFLNNKMKECDFKEKVDNFFDLLKLQSKLAVEFAKCQPKYYRMGMMFMREKGNKIYDTCMNVIESNSEKVFEELIGKAIQSNDFRSGISKDFIVKVVSFLLTRYDEIFYMNDDLEDIEFDVMLQDIDHLIDFMKYGLGNQMERGKR